MVNNHHRHLILLHYGLTVSSFYLSFPLPHPTQPHQAIETLATNGNQSMQADTAKTAKYMQVSGADIGR